MDIRQDEQIHPVTFEVAETLTLSGPRFQARARFNGFATVDIGGPQRRELDALEVIARAFEPAAFHREPDREESDR